MAPAMLSLPVPVSPNSNTGAELFAPIRARHHRRKTRVAADQPLFVDGCRLARLSAWEGASGAPALWSCFISLNFLDLGIEKLDYMMDA